MHIGDSTRFGWLRGGGSLARSRSAGDARATGTLYGAIGDLPTFS